MPTSLSHACILFRCLSWVRPQHRRLHFLYRSPAPLYRDVISTMIWFLLLQLVVISGTKMFILAGVSRRLCSHPMQLYQRAYRRLRHPSFKDSDHSEARIYIPRCSHHGGILQHGVSGQGAVEVDTEHNSLPAFLV